MNKDELLQVHARFERAARIFCDKVGMDPDRVLQMPGARPKIAGVPPPIVKVPQWKLVAEELFDLSARLTALREAATDKPKVLLNA